MAKPMSVEELERQIAELTLKGKPRGNVEISNLLVDLASNYMRRGQFEEAIDASKKAIDMTPDRAYVHNGLAMVFIMADRKSEAAECYEASLKLSPTNSCALQNLATIRYEEKNFEEAERLCRKAIKIAADGCVTAHAVLAKIASERGDDKTSQKHYAETLRSGYWNKSGGFVKCDRKDLQSDPLQNEQNCKSIRLLRDFVRQNPTDAYAIGRLYIDLQTICDWKDFGDRMKKLADLIDEQLGKNLLLSMNSYSAANMFPISLKQQLAIASFFSGLRIESAESPLEYRLNVQKQMRIGYVLTGPIKFPLVAKKSRLDADRFEVFYYYLYDRPINLETLAEGWNDHTIDLSTFGNNWRAAATRIASDGIQILINLNDSFKSDVHIDNASILFAHRPAPIQAVYRCKLGTTGASCVDYFITDKVASPLQFAYGYSEKLAYMPNGMFVCDDPAYLERPKENLKEKEKHRRRFNLPESASVFGVNGRSSQIDPETFDCWCEILRRVPGSVLWFFVPYLDETQSNLKKEAKKRKINPYRLIFIDVSVLCSKEPIRVDYLLDVFLDTPMSNSFTSMEPICRGIPTATLPRESFTSRLTASMLTSIGCEELIAKSKLWYIEMNVNMGNQPDLRQQMKDRMWENLPDSNFFKIDQYFNDLEGLYEKMWKRMEMGEKPEHIV